ncbi:MAG: cupin domain-containing protein [Parcubacteria group bacterium]|nr:cupin domain-containing protein [Parcubacteria group bacterium]
MSDWIKKDGYSTRSLGEGEDLNLPKSQIILARFEKGKGSHYHKEKTEFFYCLKGKGKVIIDSKEQELESESSIIIKPGMKHEFISDPTDPLEAIVFKVNSEESDTYT